MQTDLAEELTSGTYTLADAARYTAAHYNTTRRWLRSRASLYAQTTHQAENCVSTPVSFLELVELKLVRDLREAGLSLQKIRLARERMCEDFGWDYPLAQGQLLTDGRDIFVRIADTIGDAQLLEIFRSQYYHKQVLLPFLKQLDYQGTTGVATRWRPGENISIDPFVHMGRPVVSATGVATSVVYDAWVAHERETAMVADLFGLENAQVLSAVQYETALMN